jgi:hypothetical protein
MKNYFWIAFVAAGVSALTARAIGQQKVEKLANPVYLELTAEVAATTEEGYPSVLRITIKNVGNVAVDMPMPMVPCVPGGGGVEMRFEWHSSDPEDHSGVGTTGKSCWQEHFASLMYRVRHDWIHLQPGEFIIVSESLRGRFQEIKPGTVEYWVEYIPPKATPKELAELQQAGYVIPAEKIETAHQTFFIR